MEIGNKEKKINDSPEPVTISGTRTILNQLINCICKIKVDQSTGTGFFCKINYGINQTKKFFMTNFHVLNKNYYDKSTKIDLLINDEKVIKQIDLTKKRQIYFNDEKYDIILIEILDIDGIGNFLELDDDLFRDKEDALYKQKSIYVLQYPNGKNAAVSYGVLKSFNELNKSDIRHSCSTEKGSSGSPILNLETYKVIGIHKEGSVNFNFNMGTILKYPLIDFIENKLNEEKAVNNIINNFSNLSIKGNNFNNIINISNIENKINNEINIQVPKINIIFDEKTDPPRSKNLIIDYGTTVDQVLKEYLILIKKQNLIGLQNKIQFIYNGRQLLFRDKTPIEKFFKRKLDMAHIHVIYSNF